VGLRYQKKINKNKEEGKRIKGKQQGGSNWKPFGGRIKKEKKRGGLCGVGGKGGIRSSRDGGGGQSNKGKATIGTLGSR